MSDLYAFDTNVYIHALRDVSRLARLKKFLMGSGTRMRMAAVVALELRAGARTPAQQRAVEDLLAPYAQRERIVVPSFAAFVQAGRVLAALAAREPYAAAPVSLTNDALLSASCREANVVLVTENTRDFAAIQRHLRGFRFKESAQILGRFSAT